MRNKISILIIFSILLIGCNNNNSIYDNSIYDESILSGLPNFEYAGYTYYIHPNLTMREINSYNFNYNEFYDEVKSLDSYGFKSWFIPTIYELEAAKNRGLLRKDYYKGNDYYQIGYLSSSKQNGSNLIYNFENYNREQSWATVTLGSVSDINCVVCPMIKFRNN